MDPVASTYQNLADLYDTRWAGYIDSTLRLVVDALELRGDERLLDVACGTGALAQRLLVRWPALQITGVDISGGMLQQAVKKDLHCSLVQTSADHLPFASESFDIVVCANAFHFFRNPDGALAEMRRVLTPRGRILLLDWCDDYWSCQLCSIWLRWTDPAFYRTYGLKECRQRMTDAGFRVEQTTRARISWIWGLMRLSATPSEIDGAK